MARILTTIIRGHLAREVRFYLLDAARNRRFLFKCPRGSNSPARSLFHLTDFASSSMPKVCFQCEFAMISASQYLNELNRKGGDT